MKDHYGFSDSQMSQLKKDGIKEIDLMKAIPLFDPNGTAEPLSQVSLYYYVDKHGNFNDPPNKPHKKIARMLFENLRIKEKINISEYMESADDNFED